MAQHSISDAAMTPARALVVVSQPDEGSVLRDILEPHGFVVSVVTTTAEGLALATNPACALILTGSAVDSWRDADSARQPFRTVVAVLSARRAQLTGRIGGVDTHIVQSSANWQHDLVQALGPPPSLQVAPNGDATAPGAEGRTCLDVSELRAALDAFGFDESGIEELVGLFLSDTPDTIALLTDASAAGNHDQIASLAHALKSPSAIVCAHDLSAMAAEMEGDGRAGRCADAVRKAALLSDEFIAVRDVLRLEFPQLANG